MKRAYIVSQRQVCGFFFLHDFSAVKLTKGTLNGNQLVTYSGSYKRRPSGKLFEAYSQSIFRGNMLEKMGNAIRAREREV